MDLDRHDFQLDELVERIKAHDQFSKIPVIAVTASAMKTSEDEISSICDGFLRKPFKMEDLMNLLTKYLKHS